MALLRQQGHKPYLIPGGASEHRLGSFGYISCAAEIATQDLAAQPQTPATVLVTHHVEEIPPSFTHVLLLESGSVLAAGPISDTLTEEALAACFGLPVELEHRHGRWTARGR